MEGLSDAVFGFAITLLVVSLEVPRTAAEVLHAMRGFFAFGITFFILFSVWRLQFHFFRRYGLEDRRTVTLTGVLLFVILFFVYPLKYVFGALADRVMLHAGWLEAGTAQPISGPDFTLMYLAFSLGWVAVMGVFALLYRHAYSRREELGLSPLEVFDTRVLVRRNAFVMVPGAVLSVMNVALYLKPGSDEVLVYPFIALLLGFAVVMARGRRTLRAQRAALVAQEQRTVEA